VSAAPNYVVAYEATERGREAVELGVALARLTRAELRICLVMPRQSVVPTKVSGNPGDYKRLLGEQGEEWLSVARDLVPSDITASTHLVWAEATSEGLLLATAQFESDRIVVGAARAGLLGRFSIGSVASALLHASPVPVALAPRGYRAPRRISRITCAIGTRVGWEALLDSMAAIADDLTVDLRFITLLQVGAGPEVSTAASESHLRSVLDQFRQRARFEGTMTTTVGVGRDIEDAVDRLDWRDDEVVFVGSSRLASHSRIFLGSTANRMLRTLPVPLVVVPNPVAQR
jgi:nucleotide-binding universal stress UspA family protein